MQLPILEAYFQLAVDQSGARMLCALEKKVDWLTVVLTVTLVHAVIQMMQELLAMLLVYTDTDILC